MSKACKPEMPFEHEYNRSLPVKFCSSTLAFSFFKTLAMLDVQRLDNAIHEINYCIFQ